MTRVAVVGEDPELPRLVATSLERSAQFAVETLHLDTWAQAVGQYQPEVVLLDLDVAVSDPPADLSEVLVTSPQTMVAVLTTRDGQQQSDVVPAGAFVLYDRSRLEELPERIAADLDRFRQALAGEDILAPATLARRQPPAEPTRLAAR